MATEHELNTRQHFCVALNCEGRYLVVNESTTIGGVRKIIETTTDINEADLFRGYEWAKLLKHAGYGDGYHLIPAKEDRKVHLVLSID